MGSRQSVAQPPRQRSQSQSHSSSAALNGQAGPSTSSGVGGGGPSGSGDNAGARGSRQVRSQSVIVPLSFSQQTGNNDNNSPDSSDDDRPLATSSTGIPTLDRLLRLNNAFSNAGLLVNQIPFRFFDIKCPVCHKMIPSDDVEYHLVVCLTRPRITYNEDVLSEDKGECPICFDDMCQGDTIARLPCLCVYHKGCIDSWFKVKNSCPEHPSDD